MIGDLNKAVSWSEYITDEQLNAYRRKALVLFQLNRMIFHPVKFFKTLFNVLRGVAETKTESYFRTFLKRARVGGVDDVSSENYTSGSYTPYDSERTVAVLFKSVAHYGYSNSGLKAFLTVFMDFMSWLKGKSVRSNSRS